MGFPSSEWFYQPSFDGQSRGSETKPKKLYNLYALQSRVYRKEVFYTLSFIFALHPGKVEEYAGLTLTTFKPCFLAAVLSISEYDYISLFLGIILTVVFL